MVLQKHQDFGSTNPTHAAAEPSLDMASSMSIAHAGSSGMAWVASVGSNRKIDKSQEQWRVVDWEQCAAFVLAFLSRA